MITEAPVRVKIEDINGIKTVTTDTTESHEYRLRGDKTATVTTGTIQVETGPSEILDQEL